MHRWASLAGVDWHLPYPTNTCAPTEAGVPLKPHPQPGFALKLDNPTDHDSIPGLGLGRQHFLSATFLWALGWRLCWDHGVVAVLVLTLLGCLAMLYPVPASAWHLLGSALVCLGHLLPESMLDDSLLEAGLGSCPVQSLFCRDFLPTGPLT